MREPCPDCGHEFGYIREASTQDTVRCLECDRWCYNAPRTETGKKVRTGQTTHEAIKPKHRVRILERANGRCELCGKGPDRGIEIHVGHIISVERGHALGMGDLELNGDENLMALCAECNLGLGKETIPLRMMVKVFMARASRE
jgi:5-methylcytosine-specific restriction endonuclease McrA